MEGKRKINALNYRRIYFERTNLTQAEYVADYMKRYGSITSDEAYEAFDCRRLAPAIFELRKEYDIKTIRSKSRGMAIYEFAD